MYKVYSDSYLLFNDEIDGLKIFSPKLELELNKTGSFEFTIYDNHTYYSLIKKLKSVITVYQDETLIFKGRVIDEEIGMHNEKHLICEGQLAFFLDSIQRPFDFSGTLADLFTQLINNHNEQVDTFKEFTNGVDSTTSIAITETDYKTTWEIIEEVIELVGGYISVTGDEINYSTTLSTLSTQKIEFSKNLIDLKRTRNGEDIKTAIIPLGAKIKNEEEETEERLTIKSVNNDIDYIYDSDAVSDYGWIFSTVIFDDVTDATELLTKGQEYLAGLEMVTSIELSAADLATIEDVNSFKLGVNVSVKSSPHSIDQNFLVQKLSINLLSPESNTLTLGGILKDYTDKKNAEYKEIINRISNNEKTTTIVYNELQHNMQSSVQQSETNIMTQVSDSYYLKDETDSLISSVSTTLEQTADGFEMEFNQFETDLNTLSQGMDSEFEEIKQYIRFESGKILLGEVGNQLELEIANDRISFLQNNFEVAYLSNNKLYVTDGEYTNSLRIGDFSFVHRENGNVSFKKIV